MCGQSKEMKLERKSRDGSLVWFLDLPELNISIFSFLLNFVWEFWQVPLFRAMAGDAHWEGIKTCTQATLGDAGIALLSFWAVSLSVKSRQWILNPRPKNIVGFVFVGVLITVVFEWLATKVFERWTYRENMPIVPILGTGLLPILQWIFVPLLVVWFVRRQLT